MFARQEYEAFAGRGSQQVRRGLLLRGRRRRAAAHAGLPREAVLCCWECVRGLREHASANLYDLMIGLVEKPLLRAVLREA